MDLSQLEHYAPYVIVILIFLFQNNVFVKPEQLEKKHREISNEIDEKLERARPNFVEINAYKEFQNHVLQEISNIKTSVNESLSEIKDLIMRRKEE